MDVPTRGNVGGKFIPARYILAVLGSIAMAIVYGLKVNLSVAMVGMLNHTAIGQSTGHASLNTNASSQCGVSNLASHDDAEDGPFEWSSQLQGVILSCYFWGYLISQMPGARVAEIFSAKWVMFFSVAINVVCTLLTPVCAWLHPAAIITMRVGEGIGGGVTFPAMHVLLSKWAPPSERSVLSALVYAGTSLGTVLSLLMAGGLTAKLGWQSVFYVMGGLSSLWCILWVVLIQDTPAKQSFISREERAYIQNSLGTTKVEKKYVVPWSSVFKSAPFYAILISHTCSNWGWYMVLIELPFYMKQVLKFNMSENTLAVALPFLTMWMFSIGLSRLLDFLRAKGKLSTTWARKIATLFASVVPMLCLLWLCYVGCNRTLAVALMTIAVTSIGGMFSGFLSNHIDIAPNFAGTLMAMTNTMATLPGIVVPIFVGFLTTGNPTISAWRVIFFVTIALYLIEIMVYTLFGSGEEQPWNKVINEDIDEETEAMSDK